MGPRSASVRHFQQQQRNQLDLSLCLLKSSPLGQWFAHGIFEYLALCPQHWYLWGMSRCGGWDLLFQSVPVLGNAGSPDLHAHRLHGIPDRTSGRPAKILYSIHAQEEKCCGSRGRVCESDLQCCLLMERQTNTNNLTSSQCLCDLHGVQGVDLCHSEVWPQVLYGLLAAAHPD